MAHKYILVGGSTVGSYSIPGEEDPILVMEPEEGPYVSYKIKSISKFKPNDFTTNFKFPDKTKIALINDIETFDIFTAKYGKINLTKEYIYIKWARVAQDFQGFYLDKTSVDFILRRRTSLTWGPFERRVISWWIHEYSNIFGVMIF